ncbi:MAG TPA: hypothetical protein VJ821_07305 [Anaerolineales bacterium]|nr:hypothetical protein [Anaerolineales bacterium]
MIGTRFKKDWSQIDLEQFRRALGKELEHGDGRRDLETNVTGYDPVLRGKIAYEAEATNIPKELLRDVFYASGMSLRDQGEATPS